MDKKAARSNPVIFSSASTRVDLFFLVFDINVDPNVTTPLPPKCVSPSRLLLTPSSSPSSSSLLESLGSPNGGASRPSTSTKSHNSSSSNSSSQSSRGSKSKDRALGAFEGLILGSDLVPISLSLLSAILFCSWHLC
jgi:hypothetical protein